MTLFSCLPRAIRRWVPLLVLLGGAVVAPEPAPGQSPVDFGREVQPLLARRCFSCHGPDKAEGGLRLHQRDAALAKLDSGAMGIVPGKPEQSELLTRVSETDESLRMPPEGKPLTDSEVTLLRRWIAGGAVWETHWAFRPTQSPAPPIVKNAAWVRNPIDAFILNRLQQNGLPPNPPADKVTLLRRATFDLTGLPPTPSEVEAFLKDDSPAAFENVVDRLLDSPRYGERWGRHWLDVVRYADTNSFERDGLKPHSWRYRDYVIRSLNADKPYDQFIIEQLAGDELPQVTTNSLIATGFYRLGLWDDEPADRLQAEYDGLDDVLRTTAEGFLGLTVGCARCHDHKIDPIPQKDYYSLLAFFRGVTPMAYGGPNVERPLFKDEQQKQSYEAAVKDLERRRNETQAQVTAIETEFRQKSSLASGTQPVDLDDLEYRFYRDSWDKLPDFDALKPETVARLDKPYFDIRPATRADHFGFVFTGVLKVPQDGEYTFTLDSDDGARLTVDGKKVVERDGIHGVGDPQTATVTLKQGRVPIRLDYFQGVFGKGLSVTWSGPAFEPRFLSATTATGTDVAALQGKPLPELMNALGEQVLGKERFAEYRAVQKKLDELRREKVPADFALIVTEFGPQTPETFIHLRGNPHVPGDQVSPAFPALFEANAPQIPTPAPGVKTPGRRLALAEWIASPQNRLTARVAVNRMWQHHFGRGIVRSTNNFGQLGDLPTHPDLLDWLAGEFVRNGWRMKPLHKLIMLSATYQMSSAGQEQGLAQDPANDLFWRFNMRRLSAEEIRDSLHAVNGRLNLTMFGPGFYPEISQEVLAGQSRPGEGWGNSSLEEQARRSVYIHVKRSLITPILANFDFPETDTSCDARFATTQPGQSLGMLNGDFVNREAAFLAKRLRREAGDDPEAQVRLALQLSLSRIPDNEVARGLKLIETLQSEQDINANQALDYYCLVLLNTNAFLYLD